MQKTEPTFPLIAVSRLRMTTDGEGVTTLVAAHGCPLRCKMCLNPRSWKGHITIEHVTPRELYEKVKIDDLYFRCTNGGITFGGGEPLLHASFIAAFAALVHDRWQLRIETSLHVPIDCLKTAAPHIDEFIIDIKDMNPSIYRAYTDRGNDVVLSNLEWLSAHVDPQKVLLRIPSIPGFNTPDDTRHSIDILSQMGFSRFDCFTYRNTAIE